MVRFRLAMSAEVGSSKRMGLGGQGLSDGWLDDDECFNHIFQAMLAGCTVSRGPCFMCCSAHDKREPFARKLCGTCVYATVLVQVTSIFGMM